MSGYRACSQCQGLMVLEDQGEMLEALDVMSLFEYRCRACGHLEKSERGSVQMETKVLPEDQDPIQHRWSELDPCLTRRPAQSDSREPLQAETSLAE